MDTQGKSAIWLAVEAKMQDRYNETTSIKWLKKSFQLHWEGIAKEGLARQLMQHCYSVQSDAGDLIVYLLIGRMFEIYIDPTEFSTKQAWHRAKLILPNIEKILSRGVPASKKEGEA